jgi:signal peptidase I
MTDYQPLPGHTAAPDPDAVGPDGLTARQRRSARIALALVAPLTAILLALILVFFVFFDTTTIDGGSMYPTLWDHDYVLITRGLKDPARGDIVVLHVLYKGTSEEWVKRIIGIGGDRVNVAGDMITVNGQGEQFPHMIIESGSTQPNEELTVGQGQIFLAGDNRPVSLDSRFVGTFPASSVHGRVVAIYAPISRIGSVPEP